MTELRQAAQQALKELRFYIGCYGKSKSASEAVDDLEAALAKSEQDWSLLEATQQSLREHMAEIHRLRAALAQPDPIYLASDGTFYPIPRQRKPLTGEEIQNLSQQHRFDSRMEKFVRIIEAAHGIKEQP